MAKEPRKRTHENPYSAGSREEPVNQPPENAQGSPDAAHAGQAAVDDGAEEIIGTYGAADGGQHTLADLQQELEKARQQVSDNFEGWQRERADFMNYRKRVERDQSQMSYNVKGEIIKRYLVILDDLERALKARPEGGEGAVWAEGIELIYRKLVNILESEGVTRIPAEQAMFDPNLHEAIAQDDSPDHQSGEITEVLQQGYKIGDRILRPALVRVAR